MTLVLGGNSATWGFTARCQAAAEVFGPAMMVWLASAGPQDAARYPNCVHFLRLDNWMTGEAPAAYVQRQTARIQSWHTTIANLILIPGNESDQEAGHSGESIQQYADALRAAFPGVKVANVPLTVANTANATYTGCDVAVAHAYFERQHPETMGDPQFGRSYQHAQASGLPTYCTEFNVVQTNCPIDWPDRNLQAAAWLGQAEGDGVAGAAFFILDAAPDWASYDVGVEAAQDILAHRKGVAPATANYLQFVPLSWTQYQDIINHGSFPNAAEPMLNLADYSSLIAVMTAAKIDPRLPLAFTWAEGHDGTDPGLVAASVNNFGGIKFSGAPGTYDSKIPADTGGTYAGFPDLTAYWHEWVRIMNNSIIGPSFNSGDLVSAVEHYTNGPGTGHNKVDKYNEYVSAYPADGAPPPSVTTGVTGDDIIDKARQYIGQQVSDGTLDSWNPSHPWGGYCEAFTEGVPFVLGLTVVHRGSALQKLQAVTAQEMLETSWPPEHGGCCLYGADFDAAGHATLWDADQGAFLGTLENPSNIGYHPATGAWRTQVAGWYRIPGVTAARRSPPIVVPPPNLVIPGNPANVGRDPNNLLGVGGAIRTFWESLPNPFVVLGFPLGNEVTATVTDADKTARTRTVQKFERSWVIFQPEAPEGWRVVLALLNQKITVATP